MAVKVPPMISRGSDDEDDDENNDNEAHSSEMPKYNIFGKAISSEMPIYNIFGNKTTTKNDRNNLSSDSIFDNPEVISAS